MWILKAGYKHASNLQKTILVLEKLLVGIKSRKYGEKRRKRSLTDAMELIKESTEVGSLLSL